ncbi:hypothetical protein DPMN_049406 [Dreissena polymorpha]|uniref:Uncharacterized protein n=1 Tax=Dreissena polymorpha TaxID=45954 RepID=A0A9D4CF97_DREPO|nr:hypothetical protein DPMN_049406 [Dreissena polymorpha]
MMCLQSPHPLQSWRQTLGQTCDGRTRLAAGPGSRRAARLVPRSLRTDPRCRSDAGFGSTTTPKRRVDFRLAPRTVSQDPQYYRKGQLNCVFIMHFLVREIRVFFSVYVKFCLHQVTFVLFNCEFRN